MLFVSILKCEQLYCSKRMHCRFLARHWNWWSRRHIFPYNYERLTEFSLYFFQKWAFIGRLDTLLAKTLLQCTLIPWCLKFDKFIPLKSKWRKSTYLNITPLPPPPPFLWPWNVCLALSLQPPLWKNYWVRPWTSAQHVRTGLISDP